MGGTWQILFPDENDNLCELFIKVSPLEIFDLERSEKEWSGHSQIGYDLFVHYPPWDFDVKMKCAGGALRLSVSSHKYTLFKSSFIYLSSVLICLRRCHSSHRAGRCTTQECPLYHPSESVAPAELAGQGRSLFSLKKHCVKPFHLSFSGLCTSNSVGTLGLHNALLKILQEIPAVFGPRVLYSVVSLNVCRTR